MDVCAVCQCLHECECTCAHGGQMLVSSVFLNHFPLYFSEVGGLSLNLELDDLVSIASWLALGNSCLWFLSAKIASGCHDLPAFMWVLGAQTPVLMPEQQLLCSLSHLPITEILRHRSHRYALSNFQRWCSIGLLLAIEMDSL